jgi:hypothetical protein
MTKNHLCFVIAIVAVLSQAHADESGVTRFESGGQLHSDCVARSQDCSRYIIGVADTLAVATAMADSPKVKALLKDQDTRICQPHGITAQQTVDAVSKYLWDDPKYPIDAPAAAQVWEALIANWPCPGR